MINWAAFVSPYPHQKMCQPNLHISKKRALMYWKNQKVIALDQMHVKLTIIYIWLALYELIASWSSTVTCSSTLIYALVNVGNNLSLKRYGLTCQCGKFVQPAWNNLSLKRYKLTCKITMWLMVMNYFCDIHNIGGRSHQEAIELAKLTSNEAVSKLAYPMR